EKSRAAASAQSRPQLQLNQRGDVSVGVSRWKGEADSHALVVIPDFGAADGGNLATIPERELVGRSCNPCEMNGESIVSGIPGCRDDSQTLAVAPQRRQPRVEGNSKIFAGANTERCRGFHRDRNGDMLVLAVRLDLRLQVMTILVDAYHFSVQAESGRKRQIAFPGTASLHAKCDAIEVPFISEIEDHRADMDVVDSDGSPVDRKLGREGKRVRNSI